MNVGCDLGHRNTLHWVAGTPLVGLVALAGFLFFVESFALYMVAALRLIHHEPIGAAVDG